MSAATRENQRMPERNAPMTPAEAAAQRMAVRREALSLDTLGPMPSRVIPHAMRVRLARLAPPPAPRPAPRDLDV
jgi:hypothetical protein